MCGLAPSRVLGALSYVGGGWESASIRMLPTGKVEVVTGASAHGQGHETAFSQIVADRLGVPFEDVEVLHGDTQIAHKGLDTYGSRSLVVGGIAVVKAAEKVVEKAKVMAAHLLEASADDLEFGDGKFTVRGTDQAVSMGEIALRGVPGHNLPDGIEPTLDSDATFDPEDFSFPHGTHLCATEVDTETGQVTIRSYVCVDDIGEVVNPLIVEGQVHGGLAQGIAQALYEEAVYDDQGTLTTATFVDYLVPSAADLPHFVTDRTDDAVDDEPVGRQGSRRGRHHRLDAGGGQRRGRRGAPPRREGRRDADVAATRLAGDPGRERVMIPAPFDYHAPTSVDEAVQLLGAGRSPTDATSRCWPAGRACCRCCACGSRRPRWSSTSAASPTCADIRDDGDAVVIGAMATHDAVMRSDVVRQHALLLARATETVADPQVRHRGTFGGALVHADPAGDLPAPALALDAQMVIAGPDGARRTVAAADFFEDLFTTAVGEDELLVQVRVPKYTGWGAHYEKFNRIAQAWAIVGAAVALRVDGGSIAEARVGLTNMGSVPVRARDVEQALVGLQPTAESVRSACAAVGAGTTPPSDSNADADYRRHLAGVLTGRAVVAAGAA